MLKSVLCLILCYTFLIFVSARFQDFVDAKLKAMPMFNRRYSSSQLEPAGLPGLPGLPGPVRVVFNSSLQTTTVATKTIFDIALEKSFFSSLWSNYRKQFSNVGKERFPTFVDNFKTVTTSRLDYKNGLAKFELEMNKFSHLTLEEIRKSYTGARRSKPRLQRSLPHASIKANILESVDYRPYLQPITDQGACGSCVAHAVSAMIEGTYAVKKNICFHLSRQMLIDCGWYTHTCANGSYIDKTLELIKSIGLERTDCFKNAALVTYKRSRGPPPMTMLRNISREQNFRNYLKELSCNGYRKGHPKCFCDVVSCRQGNDYSRIENFERMDILRQQGSDFARILDYHWLSSEDEMLSALNLYGPLTASIRVTKPFYLLGNNPDNIFSVEDCTIRYVNEEGYHAITIVGYGTNHDHVPYWLIRNSWGAQWCDHGYFKMIRGRNMCGIADDAYYVVLQ